MNRNFAPSLHSVISTVRRPFAVSLAAACALVLGSARPAQAQAVYTYQGAPFEIFSLVSSYLPGDAITITLTLDEPLEPNLPLQDISLRPGLRLVLSDGHQTLTWSLDDAALGYVIGAGTDATGQIVEWDFGLFDGILHRWIESWRFGAGSTLSLNSTAVMGLGPDGLPGDYAYNFTSSGTWTSNVTGPGADTMVKHLLRLISDPALALTSGQINSLSTKLQDVLTSIAAGETAQAVNQLNAFINQVQAAANGKISAQVAAMLIAAAQAIIAVLLI